MSLFNKDIDSHIIFFLLGINKYHNALLKKIMYVFGRSKYNIFLNMSIEYYFNGLFKKYRLIIFILYYKK